MADAWLDMDACDTLAQDGGLVLRRCQAPGRPSLLAVTLEQPTAHPRLRARLERAYALREELDDDWAAMPLALQPGAAHSVLFLTDPGGELLSRRTGLAWALTDFFQLAVGLSAALRKLHARGLVHRDLKPSHVLADVAGGRVWLTGFGVAFPARSAAENPDDVIGTYAYMAPEQTGRAHPVDPRSDLYSMGVMLYQLLAGELPFQETSALGWIHCHVARAPAPLPESVPAQLAAIVFKLLAKSPLERYQTAAGVEADLRRCQRLWTTSACNPVFPLAEHDAHARLAVPAKLVGRAAELRQLKRMVEQVRATGTRQLALLMGPSGIGKSALVGALRQSVAGVGVLFAAGKFDQYKRNIPYATIAQGFAGLLREALAGSDAEVAQVRSALQEALGANGQLIVSLVPELALLIGDPPAAPELMPQLAAARFQTVFRRFVEVFARAGRPLVLFVDDLQWLDAATLALFEHLASSEELRHVLWIGAYREGEVDAAHPLWRFLDAVRGSDWAHELQLRPLEACEVDELVADTLATPRERTEALSALVHARTEGNPLFAVQLLATMLEERMVFFDPELARWDWNPAHLRAAGGGVLALLQHKLVRLAPETLRVLMWLACFGGGCDARRLALVGERDVESVERALGEALDSGLISRAGEGHAFVHDRVQEATYAMLDEAERAAAHRQIGRMLLEAQGDSGEGVFEIVYQLDRASAPGETSVELASLALSAGRRARDSAAYEAALRYCTRGESWLSPAWRDTHHALGFALAFLRAECELLTGDTGAAEARLAALRERAETLVELATVTSLQIDLYNMLDRSERSIEVGLAYLQRAGIDFPRHPTQEELAAEFARLRAQLERSTSASIAALPPLRDPEVRATVEVLTKVEVPALFVDERLSALVTGRLVNLSLEHGNSAGSCFAYAKVGPILRQLYGDHERATQLARLSMELVERPELAGFKARVYCVYGYVSSVWIAHLREAVLPLRRARELAAAQGELSFVLYASAHLGTIGLGLGAPLADIEREAQQGLELARRTRFGVTTDFFLGQLALTRALRGVTPHEAELEQEYERQLEHDRQRAIGACWWWIRKLQAHYLAERSQAALEASERARRLLWTSVTLFEFAEYQFYAALTRCALAQGGGGDEHYRTALTHREQLVEWAAQCPANYEDRASLVDAELARLRGDDAAAQLHYERAFASASASDFRHHMALASELAARFHRGRGREALARSHLRAAHASYFHWGALHKVRLLEAREPWLLKGTLAQAEQLATIETTSGALDFEAVVRLSQWLSAELDEQKLHERLLGLTTEVVGATRGLLVRVDGEPHVVAESLVRQGALTVRRRDAAASADELPLAMLQRVLASGQKVVVEAEEHGRAALLLPIGQRGAPRAVLYLENDLLPQAFTAHRVTTLELLAAQAAISLENARLYRALEDENARRERALRERGELLREVHHRVNNNLQLMSSLLSLQATRAGDAQVAAWFHDSRHRLRAMALVHENLYGAEDLGEVAMRSHLRGVCRHLARAFDAAGRGIELALEIDDVRLPIGAAVPCGLIVNELVTNALKHAFPGDASGKIRVRLAASSAASFSLEVCDDGVGLAPDVRAEASTLGLQLVADLARQLRARMTLCGERGTRIVIETEGA